MKLDPRAVDVRVTAKLLEVELADGRFISAPLSWFPRLQRASARARGRWELLGRGVGIHWTEIDEDLSVEGLLHGTPAPKQTKARRRVSSDGGASIVAEPRPQSYGRGSSRAPRSRTRRRA